LSDSHAKLSPPPIPSTWSTPYDDKLYKSKLHLTPLSLFDKVDGNLEKVMMAFGKTSDDNLAKPYFVMTTMWQFHVISAKCYDQ